MKIALDPLVHSDLSMPEIPKVAAELGFQNLEMCSRDEFLPEYFPPRANKDRIRDFKNALKEADVTLASMLVTYRWSSPFEDEREAAVRYWKRAIEIAVELECETVNSIFDRGPSPQRCGFKVGPEMAEECETAFWRSIEELVPIFEKEGLPCHLEAHPDDFIEDNNLAVDMIQAIGSPMFKYLFCAPHTFHLGEDMAAMIRYAAPVLAHVHVADTFNHNLGWRYVVNPAGSTARIHQHLNIGEGEVEWDVFFSTLAEVGFDGIMTSQVFAYMPDKAMESSSFMRKKIDEYVGKYFKK
jgi:myo-inositol catabolism protein IolH